MSKYPFIPGQRLWGLWSAVGGDVRDCKIGERVGIGWQADSLRDLRVVQAGRTNTCARRRSRRAWGEMADMRLGAGELAFAIPVPEALESENAARCCALGLRCTRRCGNHGVRPSSRVGIVGIGGLGHLGLQFAKAFGAEVTALSTSKEKEAEALEMGADHFVNTRDTAELKKVAGRSTWCCRR